MKLSSSPGARQKALARIELESSCWLCRKLAMEITEFYIQYRLQMNVEISALLLDLYKASHCKNELWQYNRLREATITMPRYPFLAADPRIAEVLAMVHRALLSQKDTQLLCQASETLDRAS